MAYCKTFRERASLEQMEKFNLTSDAIRPDGHFDPRYTCDSDNSSPELRWEALLSECSGYALVAEDLDSLPMICHWIVYNIPFHIKHLPAGIPSQDALPNGIRQGINDFGKIGYAGPCPPFGRPPHRYRFRLFALKTLPYLPNKIRKNDLLLALNPLIIAEAFLLGLYQRSAQKAG